MKYEQVFDINNEVDFFVGEGSYEKNKAFCEKLREGNSDIILREFVLADSRRCTIVFTDGMSDKSTIERDIVLASRKMSLLSGQNKFASSEDVLQQFAATEIKREKSLSKGYISAIAGDVLVIIENEETAFVAGYRYIGSRSVGESPNEGAVVGPHEAFTENLRANTAILRRRLTDPNFVTEAISVGKRSHTTVLLCYIRGLTSPSLLESLKERIKAIDIDIINDSGELAQLIEENPNALFPAFSSTERSDIAAARLCEGNAAIMVNGSPQVLLGPATLVSLMSVGEDKYQRWSFSIFIKMLRWAAMLVAVVGPSLYVAVVSYHPGLLPTDLLIITAVNRLNVPFSAVAEVVIIELALELLREASIRMPKSISTALSIVGGLIIGDAAISAGLISPFLIIIIGLTTMASFTIPSYSLASALRIVKYMILIMTAFFGLLGLCAGAVVWISMMSAAQSFSVDFAAPFAPRGKRGFASLLQLPIKLRTHRPAYLDPLDLIRFKANNKRSE